VGWGNQSCLPVGAPFGLSFGCCSRTPGYIYFLVHNKKSDGVVVDSWTWKQRVAGSNLAKGKYFVTYFY
jgi:hypothetical protein